jgi:hypothetical protein
VEGSETTKEVRAEAKRARRPALSLTTAEYREGMLDYARKLEARAEALERHHDNDNKKE